jgi:hypothetical protein
MNKRMKLLTKILEQEKLQRLAQAATVEGEGEVDPTTADQMAEQIFDQLFDQTVKDALKAQ